MRGDAISLGSARASRAPFGASPNGRRFDVGIVLISCTQHCSRRPVGDVRQRWATDWVSVAHSHASHSEAAKGASIVVSTGSGSRALVEGPMPATTISNVIRECINSRSAFIRSADSVALHARQKSFGQKLLLRKCRWRGSNHTEFHANGF